MIEGEYHIGGQEHFYMETQGTIAIPKEDKEIELHVSTQNATGTQVNRGSNMIAHVLLNLLNKLGKRDKMRGLPSILSLLPNKFNKFNNTGARMLDSIYHIKLKLLENHIFGVKTSRFCHFYATLK